MFDAITIEKMGGYVYALINPLNNIPFYIGKGRGNRVFAHQEEVQKEAHCDIGNLKHAEILEILSSGRTIDHIIVRHGLSDSEAYLVESALIDFWNFSQDKLSNIMSGHESQEFGIKSAEEIIRQYNAPKLESLQHKVVLININKKYKKNKDSPDAIYQSVKQAWVISEARRNEIKYVLAEYQGIIVGVYEVVGKWHKVITENNKKNLRWGFSGIPASIEIQNIYKNKSIMHTKKQGAANPMRYSL